jgi:hypothetical protein
MLIIYLHNIYHTRSSNNSLLRTNRKAKDLMTIMLLFYILQYIQGVVRTNFGHEFHIPKQKISILRCVRKHLIYELYLK